MRSDQDIDTLIEELKQIRIREAEILSILESKHTSEKDNAPPFKKGDRVRIKNRLRKPSGWPDDADWDEDSGRNATVTKVSGDRVYFVTDNGVATWRVQNNLRKLPR